MVLQLVLESDNACLIIGRVRFESASELGLKMLVGQLLDGLVVAHAARTFAYTSGCVE
jgi:hypothetical protein